MKNRNTVIKYIFVLILFLIGVAGVYASLNRDRIFSYADSGEVSNNDFQNKKEDESSSSSTKKPSENDDSATTSKPTYSSKNESSNPGLKIVTTYQDFISVVERDINSFLVFGREGCHYCELYKPVLKSVADLYKIEVAYVDMAKLSREDYQSVLNSSLVIPAKCSKTGEDAELSKGFGTPLSLFVRNSTTYDCIRGYKDNVNLINSLKDIGYVD